MHAKIATLFTVLFLSVAALAFEPFQDELPIPAKIKPTKTDITITMDQIQQSVAHDFPPTTQWGYNGSYPGPTIEVESGQLLRIHWKSQLPTKHFLPEPANMGGDMSGMGAGGTSGMGGMGAMSGMHHDDPPALPDVRNVTHLHGAVVQEADPHDKNHNNDGWPDTWIVPGEEQVAEYPNQQTSRLLWYHDHATMATGRNVAAGLEGMYIIRDPYERSLNLPTGKYEIPLMFSAKTVDGNGALVYTPDIYKEYWGSAMFVNGKINPYLNVEPRKYRFRMVNGSNARTVALKLVDPDDRVTPGPGFYQIGTDSGFLQDTVLLNDPKDADAPMLYLAPAERADVVIDFSQSAGKSWLMGNYAVSAGADGQVPIPMVMLIKVGTTVTTPDKTQIPMHMKPIPRLQLKPGGITRRIEFGGIGNMVLLNGKRWTDPITEKPVLGTTEIWELVNAQPDAHPFHIHLVDFQVINRQPYDVDHYMGCKDKLCSGDPVVYTGDPIAPADNEMGWKDTVRVLKGMVTRVIMKFGPYPGYYVYHCHILEHEDMDMMRPYQIISTPEMRMP